MSKNNDLLSNAWSNQSPVIREFLDKRPDYEQLCKEVVYILAKHLDAQGIEYAGVTSRAKTLNSFLEKLQRKPYEKPFTQITDFAAARIVFLYSGDRKAIEAIIESKFEIVEKVDKLEERAANEFGYGALHYLVRLGSGLSGARYDDLKSLVCEIQVRTVLQDAWAIIEHHLVYKSASDIPGPLKRKVNALSAQFETTDEQFDSIRQKRNQYLEEITDMQDDDKFFSQEFNPDTIAAFLRRRFPDIHMNQEMRIDHVSLWGMSVSSLRQLEDLSEKNENAIDIYVRSQELSGSGLMKPMNLLYKIIGLNVGF